MGRALPAVAARLCTRDASAIADALQRMLNDWYAKMGQLIGEFEATYPDESDTRAPADG